MFLVWYKKLESEDVHATKGFHSHESGNATDCSLIFLAMCA
jgi:hypothetical protein